MLRWKLTFSTNPDNFHVSFSNYTVNNRTIRTFDSPFYISWSRQQLIKRPDKKKQWMLNQRLFSCLPTWESSRGSSVLLGFNGCKKTFFFHKQINSQQVSASHSYLWAITVCQTSADCIRKVFNQTASRQMNHSFDEISVKETPAAIFLFTI